MTRSVLILLLLLLLPALGHAQVDGLEAVTVSEGENGQSISVSLQALLFMTVLTLLPAILLTMTSFTRIVIVLGILRQAIGTQQTPSNQVLVGLAFFLSLSPSLAAVLATPLAAPTNPIVLTLPAWGSALNIVFVLGGHLVAIWVAHSIAYRLFPSRLQAIRSQYPFVFVMIGYTAASLWLISLPTASPAFLG